MGGRRDRLLVPLPRPLRPEPHRFQQRGRGWLQPGYQRLGARLRRELRHWCVHRGVPQHLQRQEHVGLQLLQQDDRRHDHGHGREVTTAGFGPSNSVQPWVVGDWSPATNPAAKYASANLESGICNHKFGEASAWACSRNGNGAYWAFDATATPVDNYRSTSAMTVYMKQDSAAWATAASVNLCMTGERTYVFHWYVDDLVGVRLQVEEQPAGAPRGDAGDGQHQAARHGHQVRPDDRLRRHRVGIQRLD